MRQLFLLAASATGAHAVTAIEKVIQMLEKMETNSTEEGQNEAVAYDKFACFCKESASDKLYSIQKDQESIEKLDARIEKLGNQIEALNQSIKASEDQIDKDTKQVAKNAKERAVKAGEFDERFATLNKAIKACKRAIKGLQDSRNVDAGLVQEAFSFAQLAEDAELESQVAKMSQQPEYKFKFQNAEIIGMLQNLVKQFKSKADFIWSEEAGFKQTFNGIQQELNFSIKTQQESVEEESEQRAAAETEKGEKEGERDQTTADQTADKAFLKDLTGQCEQKAKIYDQRSSSRADEIEQINTAIGILKKGASEQYSVTDGAFIRVASKLHRAAAKVESGSEAQLEAQDDALFDAKPVEKKGDCDCQGKNDCDCAKPKKDAKKAEKVVTKKDLHAVFAANEKQDDSLPSFIQTESVKNSRLFNYIKAQASKLKSTALLTLALNMKKDHFKKVREMINDLITKLEQQASDEKTAKGKCDEDMKAAITDRDDANIEVEEQANNIATAEANIAALEKEIATLSEEIAALAKELKEATAIRAEEKKNNDEALKNAKEGVAAVKEAVATLKSYYGSSFLQVQRRAPGDIPVKDSDGNAVEDLAPETGFDEEYKGSTDIFGLMDVLLTDFEKARDDTVQADEDSQQEFDDAKSRIDKDTKSKETRKGEAKGEKSTEEGNLSDAEEAKRQGEKELGLAKDKLQVLKGQCVDDPITHEERLARRKQEIESLKEAHNILEDMSFLQKRA